MVMKKWEKGEEKRGRRTHDHLLFSPGLGCNYSNVLRKVAFNVHEKASKRGK